MHWITELFRSIFEAIFGFCHHGNLSRPFTIDGQTYDAHISLIDPQKLRAEGCVFGGLICGGQNWTRVN